MPNYSFTRVSFLVLVLYGLGACVPPVGLILLRLLHLCGGGGGGVGSDYYRVVLPNNIPVFIIIAIYHRKKMCRTKLNIGVFLFANIVT